MPLSIPAADKFSAVVGPNTAVSDPGDTANHDVTGLTVALPRAGTYYYDFIVQSTVTVNPTTIGLGIAYSGTVTSLVGSIVLSGFGAVQSTSDSLPTQAQSLTTLRSQKVLGTITVSTAGTLAVRFNRASNAISFAAGGGGIVVEK